MVGEKIDLFYGADKIPVKFLLIGKNLIKNDNVASLAHNYLLGETDK